jgi:hypothetical protein
MEITFREITYERVWLRGKKEGEKKITHFNE